MKKAGKVSAYLLGFLVLAVVLAAFQPLSDPAGLTNPPDEYFRYQVPQYICAEWLIRPETGERVCRSGPVSALT